jgi:DNA-binding MarR family transcriptional regulator
MIAEEEYNGLIRDGLVARLGPAAFAVFWALCFTDGREPAELARMTGVPTLDVIKALDTLEKLGLSH